MDYEDKGYVGNTFDMCFSNKNKNKYFFINQFLLFLVTNTNPWKAILYNKVKLFKNYEKKIIKNYL